MSWPGILRARPLYCLLMGAMPCRHTAHYICFFLKRKLVSCSLFAAHYGANGLGLLPHQCAHCVAPLRYHIGTLLVVFLVLTQIVSCPLWCQGARHVAPPVFPLCCFMTLSCRHTTQAHYPLCFMF